jgi:hypothetical protein
MKTDKTQGYFKVSIEATPDGWIVTEKGMDTKLFYRWDRLVVYIKGRLTTEGIKS